MTAPERIYLQGAADAPDCEDPNSGVTWCWHQIDDTDVEYVRADIAARATAEQLDTCRHRIVDARNPIITSGYFCLDCGAVFGAGDHAGLPKSKQSRDSVIESLPEEQNVYPDELTPELREVLGWPNFKCARFAHLMVAAGAEIKPKAEDEQAAVLHWLIKLVLKHADKWNEAAAADLNAMRDKVQSIESQRSGNV